MRRVAVRGPISLRARHGGRRARPGLAAVWLLTALVAFTSVSMLAVDYGRVQLVKAELSRTADAAARAAAAHLGDVSAVQAAAAEIAGLNLADGRPVALDPAQDVEFGTWDPGARTFTPVAAADRPTATAVRVWARRLKTRADGAVPLSFGNLIGVSSCDVQASAVAAVSPSQLGIVGLDAVSMGGNANNSYFSRDPAVGYSNFANVGSNGDIDLTGATYVAGNARPGVGKRVNDPSKVAGSTAPLTEPLAYPPEDPAPCGPTVNDNDNVPRGAMTGASLRARRPISLPGGHYFFEDIDIGGGAEVTFTGPATLYFYGSLELTGDVMTSANLPQNLRIVSVRNPFNGDPPGPISLTGNAALYASIYAPESDIRLRGSGDIYGAIVGKSIDMRGTAAIHVDLSLTGTGSIALVE